MILLTESDSNPGELWLLSAIQSLQEHSQSASGFNFPFRREIELSQDFHLKMHHGSCIDRKGFQHLVAHFQVDPVLVLVLGGLRERLFILPNSDVLCCELQI